MARPGRPSAYKEIIEPRLDEIRKWATEGATDKDIAKALGLNPGSFTRIKGQNSDLRELLKKAHEVPIKEIKKALYKRAIGFQYTEVKNTEGIDAEGNSYSKTEKTIKTALPDVASAMVLLKHWDKDMEWTNDPAILKVRKKELELKKKQIEKEDW